MAHRDAVAIAETLRRIQRNELILPTIQREFDLLKAVLAVLGQMLGDLPRVYMDLGSVRLGGHPEL